MILVIGNVKGGVGKTTLAVNVVIALAQRRDVLLIDGDEQGTAMAFTELRSGALHGQPGYTAVALHGAAIRSQVRQLTGKFADIVIDVGGRDSGSLRAALTVADTLLIPTRPRSFDLWGVDQTADLVREAREIHETLRAVAVINAADAVGTDNAATAEALREVTGIEVAPVTIGQRKAFPNAAAAGLSVLEFHRPADPKAIDELQRLCDVLGARLEPDSVYRCAIQRVARR